MKYIVLEIQEYANGAIGTLIDSFSDRNVAEQKYHLILSSAAVSQLPCHSATMLMSDGRCVMHQSYKHAVTPEPETPVVEPVVEPEEPEGE